MFSYNFVSLTLYLLKHSVNPIYSLSADVVHIRFLHFLVVHYISAFKAVKDKT